MYTIDDNDVVHAALFVDVSGSIPADILEKHHDDLVTTIRNLYGSDYEIHLVPFEYFIVGARIYTPKSIHNMAKYPLNTSGGSNIDHCWNYMRQEKLESCIIFTDGLMDFKDDPRKSKTQVYEFKNINFLFHSGIKIQYPSYGAIDRV